MRKVKATSGATGEEFEALKKRLAKWVQQQNLVHQIRLKH